MSYVIRTGILSIMLFFGALSARAQEIQKEDYRLIFSEVAWGGSPLSTADEWLEIFNPTNSAINLDGIVVTGASGSDPLVLPAYELNSHQVFLVANYNLGDAKSVLSVAPNLVTAHLSIPNTQGNLQLKDVQGNILDSFTYTTPSFGRTNPHASAEQGEWGAWKTSQQCYDDLHGAWCGTPGAPPEEFFLIAEAEISEESSLANNSPTLETPSSSENEVPGSATPSTEDTLIEIETREEASTDTEATIEEYDPQEDSLDSAIDPHEEDLTEELVQEPQKDPSEDEEVTSMQDFLLPEPLIVTSSEEVAEEPMQEDDPHPLPTPSPSPREIISLIGVHIQEFLSSPISEDEWVEIENTGNADVPSGSVVFEEGSGKQTVIEEMLPAHHLLLLRNPKGKLNNNGDTLQLKTIDGTVFFTLTYGTETFPAPPKGFSAGRCNDAWKMPLTPTPEGENICTTQQTQTTSSLEEKSNESPMIPTYEIIKTTITESINEPSPTQGASPSPEETSSGANHSQTKTSLIEAPQVQEISFTQVKESPKISVKEKQRDEEKIPSSYRSILREEISSLAEGELVSYQGNVLAVPGIFGKRTMYLQGIQVYFYKASWPTITQEMTLRVQGKITLQEDVPRIVITSADDIFIVHETASEAIAEDSKITSYESSLLFAEGSLQGKEDGLFQFLTTEGDTFFGRDDAKTKAFSGLSVGDRFHIVGISRHEDGKLILLPRSFNDVQKITKQEHSPIISKITGSLSQTPAQPLRPSEEIHAKEPSVPFSFALGGSGILGTLGAGGYWVFRNKRHLFSF